MKNKFTVIAALAGILGITFYLFYPCIGYNFSNWDDQRLIIDNPRIRSLSIENIVKIFTDIYWLNYHPLNLLSYAVEYHFFGLNPHVIHFNNIVLHLCNVILVYLFINILSNNRIVAFTAATLFAIHPMCIESVVWASQRKDVLHTFFYLPALMFYVKYSQQRIAAEKNLHTFNSSVGWVRKDYRYYILALFFFLLSCFSKGTAVSLSLVIVCIDFLLKRKFTRAAFIDKIPFYLISLVFGIIVSLAVVGNKVEGIKEAHTLPEKIQYASYGFLFYLSKFFAPVQQSVYYPYPYQSGTLPDYYLIFPLLAFLISLAILFTYKFSRDIIFGYAFFVSAIVMMLQLKQTNSAMVADHYTYIAYIGGYYLIGKALFVLFFNKKQALKKVIFIFLSLIVITALYLPARARVNVWRNNIILWSDAVMKYPGSAAYNNLAYSLHKTEQYSQAIKMYKAALKKNPGNHLALNNLGSLLLHLGQPEAALKLFKRACVVKPYFQDAYINISVSYYNMVKYDSAMRYINIAISLDSADALAFHSRGILFSVQNLRKNAINDYLHAIRLNSFNFESYKYLGNVYALEKRYAEALHAFNLFIKFDTSDVIIYVNKAAIYILLGDTVQACANWGKAIGMGYVPSILKIKKCCPDSKIMSFPKIFSTPKVLYPSGRVKLEIAEIFENDTINKKMRHYSADGKLTEEGIIDDNGKYDGVIKWFYPSGTIKITGYYEDTVPYGLWKEFYADGTIKASYTYKNGKYNGYYTYYHNNGRLWTERVYRNGLLWEVLSNFDINGKPLDRGNLKNGNGTMKVYDENGQMQKALYYKDGVRVEGS